MRSSETRHMLNRYTRLFGVIMAVAALAVMAGCGGKSGGGRMSMPPMPVEVSRVKVQAVADKFEAVGTIEAIRSVTVVAEIDAAVKCLLFKEGGFIKRGEIIAQLDDSQLAAELARAQALRAQSQSTYNRVKAVVEQAAGAAQDLDDADAALKVAQANLDLA